jgi:DNA-binding transcriptional ArsR family regulator
MSMNEKARLDDGDVVRVLKALAHAKRFQMVQEIAAAGEISCGAACTCVDVPQPTGSHHLKILQDAGVIVSRREGQTVYLSVNQRLLDAVLQFLPNRIRGAGTSARRRRA